MYSLGIDIGTTGCKAVVTGLDGIIINTAYEEYPLITKQGGIVEQDAELWWKLACKVTREVISGISSGAELIRTVSVASQGISFVPVDKDLVPLSNAITWLDTRAGAEVDMILEKFSEKEIFTMTGKRVNGLYVLPKLLWIRKHKPEIFNDAHAFLMTHDFVSARLTGRSVTDHSLASGTMLYDVSERNWSDTLLDSFDIPKSKLPVIETSGTVISPITHKASDDTGLNKGTVVVTGGQDQKVAAYAADPDIRMATLSLGTAGAIEFITETPVIDPEMRIPLFSYLKSDRWVLESVVSTTGACYKWLKQTLFPEKKYRELDGLAASSPAGSKGLFFFPHFSGATSPHWQMTVKGAFSGMTLDTEKQDIVRSVLEGVAYQIKTNLLACENLSQEIDVLVLMGSGSSSDLWCQIMSDITGKKIIALKSPDAAGAGAAKLGFEAAGEDAADFGIGIYRDSRTFIPDKSVSMLYEEMYADYIETEHNLISKDPEVRYAK